MSGEVQTARPPEAGIVVEVSRADLKAGTWSSIQAQLFNPDVVMMVCRAIVENKGESNHD